MSRLEAILERELTALADGATPSPDAWETIQRRIADEAPTDDTEATMLTTNTTPPRRWPLAAVAAVLALIAVGIVIAIGTGGDDTQPLEPPPTAPVQEDRTTVELDGTMTGGDYTTDDDAEGAGVFTNRADLVGNGADLRLTTSTDANEPSQTEFDGAGTGVLEGSIEGLGTGTIELDVSWISRDGVVTTTATITGGSGAFADATGDFESRVDGGGELRPIWSMTLTLPADQVPDGYTPVDDPAPSPVGDEQVNDADVGSTDLEQFDDTASTPLDPGVYRTDRLGVPVTFELGAPVGTPIWKYAPQLEGAAVWLTSDAVGTEFISFSRVGSWYSADQAGDPNPGPGDLPADAIDTWIAEQGIDLIDAGDVVIGGHAAKMREFTIPATAPDPFWSVGRSAELGLDQPAVPLSGTAVFRLYLVDLDQYEPMLLTGQTTLANSDAWFEEVLEPFVASLRLGEPGPAVPGGTARVRGQIDVSTTWELSDLTDSTTSGEITSYSGTVEYSGELTGAGTVTGERTAVSDLVVEAREEHVVDAVVPGVGSGALTFAVDWLDRPTGRFQVGVVTAGTGDFAGAIGTMRIDTDDGLSGTADISIVLPYPDAVRVTASGTYDDRVTSQAVDGPDTDWRIETTFEGDLAGVAQGTWWQHTEFLDGGLTEVTIDGVYEFEGSLAGVGDGTLRFVHKWIKVPGGWINRGTVTEGTGVFEGADGVFTMLGRGDGSFGDYRFELALPRGG